MTRRPRTKGHRAAGTFERGRRRQATRGARGGFVPRLAFLPPPRIPVTWVEARALARSRARTAREREPASWIIDGRPVRCATVSRTRERRPLHRANRLAQLRQLATRPRRARAQAGGQEAVEVWRNSAGRGPAPVRPRAEAGAGS